MPEDYLPYSERKRLGWREPGGISGLLKDIDAFEKLPKWMRWIR
jgi:hypothetical protein